MTAKTRQQYLIAALACAALLGLLILTLPEPFPFEESLIHWAGQTRNPATIALAQLFHNIGHYGHWLVLALAALYLLRREWRMAVFIAATTGLAAVTTALLKYLTGRTRPDLLKHLVQQIDSSFPSGHNTFAAALAISFILRYPNRYVITAGITFMLIMGWARLMKGVHYPADILAGWSVGLFYGFTLAAAFPKLLDTSKTASK